ncbi:MAG: hypothetical protein HeimC3_14180 [Candidatus Heimdallarchaeota archaeon LC_3]|nr:MAG: hypothetical protein HeimC3_14180 [Candidatus Heimdallarchaeota archaeon LC_3]
MNQDFLVANLNKIIIKGLLEPGNNFEINIRRLTILLLYQKKHSHDF